MLPTATRNPILREAGAPTCCCESSPSPCASPALLQLRGHSVCNVREVQNPYLCFKKSRDQEKVTRFRILTQASSVSTAGSWPGLSPALRFLEPPLNSDTKEIKAVKDTTSTNNYSTCLTVLVLAGLFCSGFHWLALGGLEHTGMHVQCLRP